MADRARRRPARRARSKAAAAAPASAAVRSRHPAGAAPVVAAARRAVAAALPPRDWRAVTDVPAAVRPGCAARDRPPGLMLFLAADKVARPAVDPGAEPASPSGVSAAANSSGHRDAAAAVAEPVREPA